MATKDKINETVKELQRDKYVELYNKFRAIPKEKWDEISRLPLTEDQLKAIYNSVAKDAFANTDPQKFVNTLSLVGRVAHEGTEEDFVNLVAHGEVPALRLSAEEMEQLRGGGAPVAYVVGWVAVSIIADYWVATEIASYSYGGYTGGGGGMYA